MLYKLTRAVLLGLILSTIGVLPANAENACQAALTKTRNKLISKNVQVSYISTFNVQERSWRKSPSQYPIGVSVVFEGKAAESIMASPAFLKALGHEIVMSCEPVSIVEFGIYSTDYIHILGLSGSNKVEWFECVDASNTHILNSLPWGYTYCL